MRTLKVFRAVCLILFLAAAAPAAVVSYRDVGRIRELNSSIDEQAQKIKELREEIGKTNLEYRGFSESIKNIPEDRRAAEMGTITSKTTEFNKIIRTLEKNRQDATRLMHRRQRELAAVKSHLKKRLLPLGAAGLVFLAGFVACARSLSIRS